MIGRAYQDTIVQHVYSVHEMMGKRGTDIADAKKKILWGYVCV